MTKAAAARLTPRQSLTVGVALFSMFFGAGNLIIPPLLAVRAGTATVPALAGFLVAAIGLPVLGIVAVALAGDARDLAGRVHPRFASVFLAAIYLSIGPCLAIPRTSSTSFEMLLPLLPAGTPAATAGVVFSVAFFGVALALALRPGTVTKVLGRVTGPALVALLVLLVGSAALAPAGAPTAPQAPYDANAAVQGFLTGYQTMDLLASLVFGIIIATTIHSLGVTEPGGVAREISRAGVVAGLLMGLVYGGLALVGATLGTVVPDATNGAALLTASATLHFGTAGTVLVAAIFLIACMNVCVGLISCCATYFSRAYGADSDDPAAHLLGRVPYAAFATAFAAFACVVSNVGLDAILVFSVPLLNALYPVSIALVVMGMAHAACDRVPAVWPCVVWVVVAQSVVTSVRDAFLPALALPFDALPLADLGLAWLVPALVAAAVGVAVSFVKARSSRTPRASV